MSEAEHQSDGENSHAWRHKHVCGYCGNEFVAHYGKPWHRPCPQCRSRKTECGCGD